MRLVVPDCSVMIAAFFTEHLRVGGNSFDLSARARPISSAIRGRNITAFAPNVLLAEFLTTAAAKAFSRSGTDAIDPVVARAHIDDFLALPIIGVPAQQIAATAVDLVMSEHVSPPDSWFLAAAIHTGAELWYSHRHRDGIVEQAEEMHRGNVFVLTERVF